MCLNCFLYPPHRQFLLSDNNTEWYQPLPSRLAPIYDYVCPARTIGHLLLVIYVPILEIFKNMDLGFLIVSAYNHHIVNFCCRTTIRNGIHLCHHYWHQSMTMFVQLGHLVIYAQSFMIPYWTYLRICTEVS
jgi:hypothetical protein